MRETLGLTSFSDDATVTFDGKSMGLLIERTYPYVGAALAFVAWYRWSPQFPNDPTALLSASLTLGAILTGFLATSKAILISMHGSTIMKELQESGYIEILSSYLTEAVVLTFGFCVLVLMGLFFGGQMPIGLQGGWFTVGAAAGLAFVRVTRITLRVLRWRAD